MVESNIFTIGLIINPISGMGGSVGLKGTDSSNILEKAIELGAKPNAMNRTKDMLKELESLKSNLHFLTSPGVMGENVLKNMDFSYELLKDPIFKKNEKITDTTAEHTQIAAEIMKNRKDLRIIMFVGGDGTARDVQSIIKNELPCIGVPAGVKIYSSIFSLNPKNAGLLLTQYLLDDIPLKEAEVLDIDELEYRKGNLVSQLYGTALTPYNPDYLQSSKMGTPISDLNNQQRIAKRILELLENDVYYLIGPGTTTKAIIDLLDKKKTILGVDLLCNNKLIAVDLNEQQIVDYIEGKPTKIITSLIGRQGFLFGRGNLQITPKILKSVGPQNIIIISTQFKLNNIPNQILRIDCRDSSLDEEFRGLYRVLTDYDQIKICEVK